MAGIASDSRPWAGSWRSWRLSELWCKNGHGVSAFSAAIYPRKDTLEKKDGQALESAAVPWAQRFRKSDSSIVIV